VTPLGEEEGTVETRFKLSKCREEFTGLKETSGKSFGHHERIFTPETSSAKLK